MELELKDKVLRFYPTANLRVDVTMARSRRCDTNGVDLGYTPWRVVNFHVFERGGAYTNWTPITNWDARAMRAALDVVDSALLFTPTP